MLMFTIFLNYTKLIILDPIFTLSFLLKLAKFLTMKMNFNF